MKCASKRSFTEDQKITKKIKRDVLPRVEVKSETDSVEYIKVESESDEEIKTEEPFPLQPANELLLTLERILSFYKLNNELPHHNVVRKPKLA